MKQLHRPDLFCWSRFDEARDLDFHSLLWVRPGAPGGNVLFDPLPLSAHDAAHLAKLGGAGWIVVTNSDHLRETAPLRERLGAQVAGPRREAEALGVPLDRALGDGDALVPGLLTLELDGSKTPGELAFLLDGTTLVTGDLVRAPAGGRLATLPPAKLRDRTAAYASIGRLAALAGVESVLVGDGWPVFTGGGRLLRELAASLV